MRISVQLLRRLHGYLTLPVPTHCRHNSFALHVRFTNAIQMISYSRILRRILQTWPGKEYLAEYRFLPIFFVSGAALEYVMIHWHFGEVNFYRTFKRRKVQEISDQREQGSRLIRIKIKH